MEINVKGVIVDNDDKWIYDWFGIEAVCPKDIIEALKELKPDEKVIVQINSCGGNVFAASEIFAALKAVPATAYIVGVAASAASIVAMACKEIYMVETALMMIHNASSTARGDYRDMERCRQMLESTNKALIIAYRNRTGKTDEELQAMMDAETWMNVEEALAEGFCDGIYEPEGKEEDPAKEEDPEEMVYPAAAATAKLLPAEVVAKMQSYKQKVQLRLNDLKER